MKRKRLIYFLSIPLVIVSIVVFNVLFYNVKYPLKYKDEILNYSKQYNLEPSFVASLINAESSFNKDVVSKKGAIGLMQILPSTAVYIANNLNEDFNSEMLFIPSINIKYGCYYLSYLNKKFYSEKEVLSAYNAGETVVTNWLKNEDFSNDGKSLKDIPYKITKSYTQKILNNKKFYKGRL